MSATLKNLKSGVKLTALTSEIVKWLEDLTFLSLWRWIYKRGKRSDVLNICMYVVSKYIFDGAIMESVKQKMSCGK